MFSEHGCPGICALVYDWFQHSNCRSRYSSHIWNIDLMHKFMSEITRKGNELYCWGRGWVIPYVIYCRFGPLIVTEMISDGLQKVVATKYFYSVSVVADTYNRSD